MHSELISIPRGLETVALRLERIYKKPIYFEDALLESPGDLMDRGYDRVPKALVFRMPVDTASEPDLSKALAAVLNAYNLESGGPRYRILQSGLGLHLIPTEMRNAQGQWVPAKNPLDQSINIPKGSRTIQEHSDLFAAAVGRVSGTDYKFVPWWLRIDTLESWFGNKGRFIWGTEGPQLAREALIGLFGQSETSFHWGSSCWTEAKGFVCHLIVTSLTIPVMQPDGKAVYREVHHDRCSNNQCNTAPGEPAKIQMRLQ